MGKFSFLRIATVSCCMLMSNAWASQFVLTVNNGSGSKVYEEGATLHVWAYPYENASKATMTDELPTVPIGGEIDETMVTRVFDHWEGDVATLDDITSVHTTMMMPAAITTITAIYRDVPRWRNPRVMSSFPPNYHSVLFMLHGGGGCATCMFLGTTDQNFINDALSLGYAVVALDSWDRFTGQWDDGRTVADNADMRRLGEVRQDLINQGHMQTDDPIYMLGASNGSLFATLFDQVNAVDMGFPVVATALVVGPGYDDMLASTDVPTMFVLAENDISPNGVGPTAAAFLNYNNLSNRGIPTAFWISHPAPVHAHLWWGVEGLNRADSTAIFNSLNDNAFLDVRGYLIENPKWSGWQAVIPVKYADFMRPIEDYIYVAYAEHRFVGDFNNKIFQFFAEHAPIVPPTITGLSASSGVVGDLITISGEAFTGTNVVFLGSTAASFVVISDTQIDVTVPAGASTSRFRVFTDGGNDQSAVFMVN
jgi:pimeloyl-ACP methyl ester carboxylesterase